MTEEERELGDAEQVRESSKLVLLNVDGKVEEFRGGIYGRFWIEQGS